MSVTPREVLDFWFKETPAAKHFARDAALDDSIRARFGDAVADARDGKLDHWMKDGQRALALLILTDQFPRNIYRGQALAFTSDAKARTIARHALDKGYDLDAPKPIRNFYYLPFMHSEDLADQDRSVELIGARIDRDENPRAPYGSALVHRDVIRRFGRFPARNAALGRASTPEEETFLASGTPF